ncbi:MAG: uL15m family ribosomal protein [Halobacteriaceae archaeon]
MTNKKRRQRGSRTHGGGSGKNRRGGGNRGGRGDAGRDKHEFHNHDPLGKYGFKRPEKAKSNIKEIDIREIDENIVIYAAEGDAEETEFGYRVDVRDIVEDGHEVDGVKVLGGGQVRHQLEVVADDFSENAKEKIQAEGGETITSDTTEE